MIPTNAREFGSRAARFTPVKIVAILTKPVTIVRRVVCSVEKPKFAMMSRWWFVSEFGTLLNAENSAKSHVFGSVSASMDCSRFHRLFSTPV